MTPEEIQSQPTWDEVLQVLRSDKLRSYRVDIETDSTVEPDATEEKQQTIEFMGAVTQFVQGAGETMAVAPETAPMFMAMLKAGVRRFKAGREVEDKIDEAAEALEARAKQMMQQPQQDPKAIEAEQKAKQAEAELQMKGQQAQQEMALKQQEMQQDAQMAAQQAQADAAIKAREAETNAAVEMEKAQLGAQTELAKAELGAETDIRKAQIQADANRDIQRQKPDGERK